MSGESPLREIREALEAGLVALNDLGACDDADCEMQNCQHAIVRAQSALALLAAMEREAKTYGVTIDMDGMLALDPEPYRAGDRRVLVLPIPEPAKEPPR